MEFEALIKEIESEYGHLNHTLGWRFLTSPKSTLQSETENCFITLNPGGDKITHEKDKKSCENGSPYLYESWKSCLPGEESLQKQIQLLFEDLGWEFDNVLSGQLVPFRSPSWAELPNQSDSLKFGIQLWKKILRYVQPKVVVAMGKSDLRTPLIEILGYPIKSENLPVGWGNISAALDFFDNCTLLSLPHLSRFRIMGRPESQSYTNEILKRVKSA
jgi:hypothetical protein